MKRFFAVSGLLASVCLLGGCDAPSPVEGVWLLKDTSGEGVVSCRRLEIKQNIMTCDGYDFRTSYTLEGDIVTVSMPLAPGAETYYKLVDADTLQLQAAQGVVHTYSKE